MPFSVHLQIKCIKHRRLHSCLKVLTYWITIYWVFLSVTHSTRENYGNKCQEKWEWRGKHTWSSLSFSRKTLRTGIYIQSWGISRLQQGRMWQRGCLGSEWTCSLKQAVHALGKSKLSECLDMLGYEEDS